MYLSQKLIRESFVGLSKISNVDSDTIRKQKVSQLRYLLAISMLIKEFSLEDSKVDLTPNTGAQRASFKTAVGNIVKLNDNGLFSQDFDKQFSVAADYNSGNNFLTTMVRWNGSYPGQNSGRDGPILDISEFGAKKMATFHKNMEESLVADYNFPVIKIPLALWLNRFEDFSNLGIKFTATDIVKQINFFLKAKLESKIYGFMSISRDEFSAYMSSVNLNSEDIFSDNITDLQFLVDEFSVKKIRNSKSLSVNSPSMSNGMNGDSLLVIFAGPPGTGKSRCARILADMISNSEDIPENLAELQRSVYPVQLNKNVYSIQFHSSYSYEDFVEGLRPISIHQGGKSDVVYDVVPGIFRAAVDLARAFSDKTYDIELNVGYEKQVSWQLFENLTIGLYKLLLRDGSFSYLGKNIISTPVNYGEKYTFKVSPSGENEGIYKIKWKPSKRDNANVVLTIDEFNRGNPSVILGEALSLLEATKRLGEQEQMKINLPYSGKEFSIPRNFHVIGTMNTSDRTLASIDMALKRRFKFIYLRPDFSLLDSQEGKFGGYGRELIEALKEHFNAINSSLDEVGIGVDQHIGHSYAFMMLDHISKVGNDLLWQTQLLASIKKVWRIELHILIREIVGISKIEYFSSSLAKAVSNHAWLRVAGVETNSIESKIKKFLNDPSGNEEWLQDAA